MANPSPAESTCNVFMMSYVVLQQKHLSDTLNLWLSFGYCNKEDQHFVYSIIVVHKAGFLHYCTFFTLQLRLVTLVNNNFLFTYLVTV